MSIQVSKGRVGRPQRVVIYAPEGIGKTTLAAQMPSPLMIDLERGSHHLDVHRIEPKTLQEFEQALSELEKEGAGRFKTIVVDTFDWLELLAAQAVAEEHKKSSIEDFGYGKGYVYLAERMQIALAALDRLTIRGFHVVLLAHSEIKKFEQPEQAGAYDRYQLKLSKDVAAIIREWADLLLFGNFKTIVAEKGEKHFKGVGGRERKFHANRTAAWDAKNRHQLGDEEPFTIETIKKAFANVGAPFESAPAAAAEAKPSQEPEAKAAAPSTEARPGHALDAVVGEHESAVNAFLVSRGQITLGQSYRDLSPSYVGRVMSRPAEFIAQATGKGVAA